MVLLYSKALSKAQFDAKHHSKKRSSIPVNEPADM